MRPSPFATCLRAAVPLSLLVAPPRRRQFAPLRAHPSPFVAHQPVAARCWATADEWWSRLRPPPPTPRWPTASARIPADALTLPDNPARQRPSLTLRRTAHRCNEAICHERWRIPWQQAVLSLEVTEDELRGGLDADGEGCSNNERHRRTRPGTTKAGGNNPTGLRSAPAQRLSANRLPRVGDSQRSLVRRSRRSGLVFCDQASASWRRTYCYMLRLPVSPMKLLPQI